MPPPKLVWTVWVHSQMTGLQGSGGTGKLDLTGSRDSGSGSGEGTPGGGPSRSQRFRGWKCQWGLGGTSLEACPSSECSAVPPVTVPLWNLVFYSGQPLGSLAHTAEVIVSYGRRVPEGGSPPHPISA